MILKLSFLPVTRVSNPISKLLRPVLEKKKLKTALGGWLSAASLVAGSLWLPVAYDIPGTAQAWENDMEAVVIETKKTGAGVVPEMKQISQGFHSWHPGIDITAPAGAEIYPIEAGVVERIENGKWGYGRSLTIDHGEGKKSLYAHLGRIRVEEGEAVTKQTVIAEIGLTGRTTGYHLHLEIIINGQRINPLPYLGKVN